MHFKAGPHLLPANLRVQSRPLADHITVASKNQATALQTRPTSFQIGEKELREGVKKRLTEQNAPLVRLAERTQQAGNYVVVTLLLLSEESTFIERLSLPQEFAGCLPEEQEQTFSAESWLPDERLWLRQNRPPITLSSAGIFFRERPCNRRASVIVAASTADAATTSVTNDQGRKSVLMAARDVADEEQGEVAVIERHTAINVPAFLNGSGLGINDCSAWTERPMTDLFLISGIIDVTRSEELTRTRARRPPTSGEGGGSCSC